MPSVCLYFHVHQPYRLRQYSVFDTSPNYFDDEKNAEILQKVAQKCYLPANRLMLDLIERHEGRFRLSYSISGVVLDQFAAHCPEVIDSFQALNRTGCVEFLAETYYHSLSFLHSSDEFVRQVEMHRDRMQSLFGQCPTVFRNTELIYYNDIARIVSQMGFKAILCEGVDRLLGYRSPTFLYRAPECPDMTLLLKHYRLSDDIAFRFSNRGWKEWPLTAEKFARWVAKVNGNGYTVNLFMDYETLGEHQWSETGIFDFLYHLPEEVFNKHPDLDWRTVSEVVEKYVPAGEYDVPSATSWADTERDLSAWLGNAMQTNALSELHRLEARMLKCPDSDIVSDWRKLQTSDHFYYMCTKYFADGDVHKYFNPYESPYDSHINFMNVLDNLRARLEQAAAPA